MVRTFSFLLLICISFVVVAQEQTVGLINNDNRSFNGYTLFSPNQSTTTYLIDNCGRQVNSWTTGFQPKKSVYLLENGNLLKTCRLAPNSIYGGRLEIYSWTNDLIWSYDFEPKFLLHHDIQPLPNGNILVIVNESFTPTQADSSGRDAQITLDKLLSEKIVEIEPVGENEINIIWEWSAWEHLIQDYNSEKANYGIVANHPELLNINYSASTGQNALTDWLHFNSIAYNADLDQIIVSSRNLCEVYILDHSTTAAEASGHFGGTYGKGGDILYRFGNPEAYDRGDLSDRKLFFQHDAQWVSNNYPDGGKIIVFNNQFATDTSAVSMFSPPTDSPGFYSPPGSEKYKPSSFDWEYISPDIYSGRISGVQQLPNGNILVCAGTSGKFFEVDTDGHQVWSYINPVGSTGIVNQGDSPVSNSVFKIKKYAPDFPGFEGKELIPGLPVELNPWASSCFVKEDTIATIAIKAYLEGPFNGASMNASCTDQIPRHQPFKGAPWFYLGTERIDEISDNMVDWVLVELRDDVSSDDANTLSIIERKAALLLSNGSIVDVDGFSKPTFYNSVENNLYVVVYHRNHLGILSSEPLYNANMNLSYDFTQDSEATHGKTDGIKELINGNWGMIAGDGNSDNTVSIEDKELSWELEVGIQGYWQADYNLDNQVDNQDKNEVFILNIGKQSQIPQ